MFILTPKKEEQIRSFANHNHILDLMFYTVKYDLDQENTMIWIHHFIVLRLEVS